MYKVLNEFSYLKLHKSIAANRKLATEDFGTQMTDRKEMVDQILEPEIPVIEAVDKIEPPSLNTPK